MSSRKNLILSRPAHADADCIRVRLDHRTIVLLKNMRNFPFWKERYPMAEVIDSLDTGKKSK